MNITRAALAVVEEAVASVEIVAIGWSDPLDAEKLLASFKD